MSTILLTTGPHDEALEFSFAMIDGNMENKLVEAVMTEQAMDLGISLISGSMTPI
jgi:hypothetical protein